MTDKEKLDRIIAIMNHMADYKAQLLARNERRRERDEVLSFAGFASTMGEALDKIEAVLASGEEN